MKLDVSRIRYRLLLVNLVIVSVPIVGIAFARFYEREMLRALEDDMVHQAQVLAEVMRADPQGLRLPEREPLLAAAAERTHTRIRLLDDQGLVQADSHRHGPPEGAEPGDRYGRPPGVRTAQGIDVHETDPVPARPESDPIPARPEVQGALAGNYSAFTRVWRWQGGSRVYLFTALPVRGADGVSGVIYSTRSTVPVLGAMYHLRATLLWVLLAAVLGTAVLSLFLAATIARPLSRLSELASRIARGERGLSLALDRRDEIGRLARTIDAMARRLDDRAQQAARLAADLSHEFKSPLTSIRGAAELLLDGAEDDPGARRRFLGNILADAGRLDRLVSRLLELSRLEADEAPLEDLDLGALVQGLAPGAEYRARATRLRGRAGQLTSALQNLLDNARQHAAPGTPVTVMVSDAGPARLRVEVHNQGPPIPAADLPRVWNRFFTTRAGAGGSGLGLPIVASAVAAHGGTVFAHSDATHGTVFGFELPV
jgi:two-component system sensor histidine kinase ChvG